MIIDVSGKTDRFNLSVVGDDFINDCCFGEDFSQWLVKELNADGVTANIICMEDFGWANQAIYNGATYLVCVAGNSDEEPGRPNYGTWHIMLERHRTLKDRLFGKNKISASDPIVEKIAQLLRTVHFSDVKIEGS